MTHPTGAQPNTYEETIKKLKYEIEISADILRSNPAWADIEKAYRALGAIEELAEIRKTPLDALLGFSPASPAASKPDQAEPLEVALKGQQETEASAEIEKGS